MKQILSIIVLFISVFSFAQNGTVSGLILDKDLGNQPLPFANVIIKGTKNGTTTDINGKYKLDVPAGNHILVISFLGYLSKEISFTIKTDEQKIINETLGSGSVKMEDVVVKATQKGRES